jgi:hypothetical protein
VHRSGAWRNIVGAAKTAGRSSSCGVSASTVSRSPAPNRSSLYLKSSPTDSMDAGERGFISSSRKLILDVYFSMHRKLCGRSREVESPHILAVIFKPISGRQSLVRPRYWKHIILIDLTVVSRPFLIIPGFLPQPQVKRYCPEAASSSSMATNASG